MYIIILIIVIIIAVYFILTRNPPRFYRKAISVIPMWQNIPMFNQFVAPHYMRPMHNAPPMHHPPMPPMPHPPRPPMPI